MDLPRDQLVSDLLHQIADLIQEADAYLCESKLSPTPFASLGKKLPKPGLCATPFAKAGKKKEEKQRAFSGIKRPPLRKGGVQPFRVDGVTNSLRKINSKIQKPKKDTFSTEYRRRERDLYQMHKRTGKPTKTLGSRIRKR